MKYLNCSHCKHQNPLQSEYQIFCNNCGKKLENNFKNWQKKFPNKTFEDFQNEIGTTQRATKPKKKKLSVKNILQISFVIVFFIIGSIYGKQVAPKLYTFFYDLAYPASELLQKDWDRQYFLNKEISFESPYLLKSDLTASVSSELDENTKKLIDQFETYSHLEGDRYAIMLMTIKYKSVVPEINLKGAADGGILQMMQKLNGQELVYNDDKKAIDHYPALIRKGTFVSEGNAIYFKMFVSVLNDNQMVCLINSWIGKNEDYELLTDRIIDSVELR
ncbi:zinc ribbon domain-containing protein [Ochrovirga pacifica]|uniref:zinc ribbon domain-containing protein n=1 Tax=Ochrovirga pacifica TaxID=1042376 RepID=UPI000255A7BD|nr:zinc ribbon domain-containing protein [Ochrovirga pacifica]